MERFLPRGLLNHRLLLPASLLGLLTLVVLFRRFTAPSSYFPSYPGLGPRPLQNLAEDVRLAEYWYQETIRERASYIARLGGVGNIKAWPGGGLSTPYTLWDFFLPTFQCPHRVERLGTMGDGGKWVCGMDIITAKNASVVYSFGVNGESSFEAAILERAPHAQVWGYDFSVDSFGPELYTSHSLSSRSHFFKYAIGDHDAHGPAYDANFQLYTVPTLMQLNGHTFIDILKVDIEGSELGVLSSLIAHYRKLGKPLPFGQLMVEIHVWDNNADVREFLGWWEDLERAGLRPFRSEPNLVFVNMNGDRPKLSEYSFVNVEGRHELVSDV